MSDITKERRDALARIVEEVRHANETNNANAGTEYRARRFIDKHGKALLDALDAAEAKMGAGEPVAWLHPTAGWAHTSRAEVANHCIKGWPQPIPLYASPPSPAIPEGWSTAAAADVLAERRRQVEVEGWTAEHDDQHSRGEMAAAASAYVFRAHSPGFLRTELKPPHWWPWAREWWKPGDTRRMLVKAAALIIAEIERLDRISASPHPGDAK